MRRPLMLSALATLAFVSATAFAGNPPIQLSISIVPTEAFRVVHTGAANSGTVSIELINAGAKATEVTEYGLNQTVLSDTYPSSFSLTLTQTPGLIPALDAALERCAALATQLAIAKPAAKLVLQLTAVPGSTFYGISTTQMAVPLTKSTVETLQCSI